MERVTGFGGIAAVVALVAALSAAAPAPAMSADDGAIVGNRSHGIKVFKKCQQCHAVRPGQQNSFGPNLHGVIGRRAGSLADYDYSDALKNAGFEWTVERLDAFLADPKKALPGARMIFKGLADPQDRADVIAYIEATSQRD